MTVSSDSRARPRALALVDVTFFRPYDTAYEQYRRRQTDRITAQVESAGWSVQHIYAQELGVGGALQATDRADAVLVAGGEDLTPEVYGGDRGYPHEGKHFERADEAEISVVSRAARRGTPVLGICRGLQIINVAAGGTLVQDLGEASIHENHRVTFANAIHVHQNRLDTDSRLHEILGGCVQQGNLPVASGHHQAVAEVGAHFRVVSRAVADGVIEAIEHDTLPILGVQWHPESIHAQREQFPAMLRALANDVSNRAASARR